MKELVKIDWFHPSYFLKSFHIFLFSTTKFQNRMNG